MKFLWKLRGTLWLILYDRLVTSDPDNRHTFKQAWTHFGALASAYFGEMPPREAFLYDQSYG